MFLCELFEIELFISIKMHLALNNLQWLICHKTKPNLSDKVLSMGQIELYCVLRLNWIDWNRTVYMYKNGFGIKIPMVDMP